MLTKDDLSSLEPGDAVEADPVFPGIDNEPLVLTVDIHDQNLMLVNFSASYHGINIGVWTADYSKEAVAWVM